MFYLSGYISLKNSAKPLKSSVCTYIMEVREQRLIKWCLGPNRLLLTEYGDMTSVTIGWAVHGSISDIKLALERCSSDWKNPPNFLKNHLKYALKLRL